MMTSGVTSVPVVAADGKVLGLVSRSDVVTLLARADHDLERDVRAALAAVGLRDWLVEVNDGTLGLQRQPVRSVTAGLRALLLAPSPTSRLSASARPAERREVRWTCRRFLPAPGLTLAGAGTWLRRRELGRSFR